jgi:hypothetical protein
MSGAGLRLRTELGIPKVDKIPLSRAQRLFNASLIRSRPSGVLGPVERPPCILQRPLGRVGATQGGPFRVRAPHMAF